jgi:hypothetical protein
MNLEIFFLELIARINELSRQDKRHHQSFGFKSVGVYSSFLNDLITLRDSYRKPSQGDREKNLKIWREFVERDKRLGLGILDQHRYNVKFRTAMTKFLTEGPPERMT